jgi:hypothetical protein
MRHLPGATTMAVLILWAISGPIGMAFDGCLMMAGMCEAPCAAMAVATELVVHGVPPPLVEAVAFCVSGSVPATAARVPELPPKPPVTA